MAEEQVIVQPVEFLHVLVLWFLHAWCTKQKCFF